MDFLSNFPVNMINWKLILLGVFWSSVTEWILILQVLCCGGPLDPGQKDSTWSLWAEQAPRNFRVLFQKEGWWIWDGKSQCPWHFSILYLDLVIMRPTYWIDARSLEHCNLLILGNSTQKHFQLEDYIYINIEETKGLIWNCVIDIGLSDWSWGGQRVDNFERFSCL